MDLRFECLEAAKIPASVVLEDINDLAEFGLLEACRQCLEVGVAFVPVLDLIKGRIAFTGVLGVLVANQLLNLARPVDYSRLEALDQVLVFASGVAVGHLLLRDVEVGSALGEVGLLGDGGHELVEIGLELFFYAIGPVVFSEKLGDILGVHLVEQVVKRVAVDLAADELRVDFRHFDRQGANSGSFDVK